MARSSTTFKKGGRNPGSGRKKGVPNRHTAESKAQLKEAMERAGKLVPTFKLNADGKLEQARARGKHGTGVDYLVYVALTYPVAFMSAAKTLIPRQVDLAVEANEDIAKWIIEGTERVRQGYDEDLELLEGGKKS